jgi:uncharacterized repeat protein (TIGR02543 family)
MEIFGFIEGIRGGKRARRLMASLLVVLMVTALLPGLSGGKVYAAGTYVITTVAGTGVAGYSGDGGAATLSELNNPFGMAVDRVGNVYIVDSNNNSIRMVDTSGNISTIAGTGDPNYSGDLGLAINAELNSPHGLTVDSSGNVYIADSGNNRIRKVDTSGNISTIAGTGNAGYSGDLGLAINAELNSPFEVAVDSSGNVYIADMSNSRIRKVDTSGYISTIVGTGNNGYSGDGGAATNAELNNPAGVAVDSSGNLYIADFLNACIRKVDTSGKISTIADTSNLNLGGPMIGVAVDSSGNVYSAFPMANTIGKVDTSGNVSIIAGTGDPGYSGDGGAATEAKLNVPVGVAVDSSGNVYTADSLNNRIRKLVLPYNVSYNDNVSTSGSVPTDSGMYSQGTAVTVLGNTGGLTRTDYTFAGWNTAADGSGTSYTPDASFPMGANNITLYAQWQSANALLSGLAVDQGTLMPAFSTSGLTYSASVANAVSSLNMSLTLGDPNQTLAVTGAVYSSVTGNVYSYRASNLAVGSNLIQVTVTAQNQTQNTYNLTVNRLSNNADLSGMTFERHADSCFYIGGNFLQC